MIAASLLVGVAVILAAATMISDSQPAPAAASASEAIAPLAQRAGLREVVIDPGHGGSEIGATGPSGITEKDVVLDIAMRLRDLLAGRLGLQVLLTRDRDIDVPLERRTEIANNFKADLFVSVHANAWRGSGVSGAETYFLSDKATDDAARRTVGIENTSVDLAGDRTLRLLLWDMAQTLHLRESSALAELVQEELNLLSGIGTRGIKQAPFRVLMGATMPAVLVEVGFLSNPEDESKLGQSSYRAQVADSIYRSIQRFRQRQAALIDQRPGS